VKAQPKEEGKRKKLRERRWERRRGGEGTGISPTPRKLCSILQHLPLVPLVVLVLGLELLFSGCMDPVDFLGTLFFISVFL